jgi:hypothetical protein
MNLKIVKKLVLLVSFVGSCVAILLSFNGLFGLCGDTALTCSWKLTTLGGNFLAFVPVFIFSCATYFMRAPVYKDWLIFSLLWLSITSYLLYLTGSEKGGSFGGLHDAYNGIVILALYALYPIISIILIAWKYWRLRN